MRIPFISKLLERDKERQKTGTPKSVHHNPKDIATSLKKYAEANTLVEGEMISDGNGKEVVRFTSGIINVDADNRTIIFDATHPDEVNTQFLPKSNVKFTLSHLGVRTQFNCEYQYSIDSPRYEHLFSFPKGIEHIQLRDAFRIRISTINPVRMTLENNDKGTHSGYVCDLSATGARIQLQKLIQPQPHRGDIYEHCYITLSDGQRIHASCQLMHWQYDPKKDITLLGVQFLQMDAAIERKLNRFLTDLQRKERSKD
ncbi:MAG: flagellar brake protein [Pseudomonadales bacterium]|nr:flagellar brake protein [Pseudomonadales bacterium]